MELGAFATCVHSGSQAASSISPRGSTIFTPLSASGLWLAVTITPTVCPASALLRSAAIMPIRRQVLSSRSALARKPAVP